MIVEAVRDMFAALTFDGTNPRDPAIRKMLGLGMDTKAGVQIDHTRVMAIPAIKRAVQIITDKMYGMPWYVFKESPDGREFDTSHPSWRCVVDQANEEIDAATLRQQLTQWAMTWGNGCAAIYRPPEWPTGGHVELIPMLPDRTKLTRVSKSVAEKYGDLSMAGTLMYETTIGGQLTLLFPGDVIHIRGVGDNPYWGYDIVELMSETFGGAIAKEEFANRLFGQGATPAGFVEMEGSLDEESEENYMASLVQAMQGLGKAHKIILLEEGAKFKPSTIDPQKTQMLEGRQFDVRLLAMTIGIKVHKLIDGANSAFKSLEQANQEHKDDDIIPWVNKWRQQTHAKLLTDSQRFERTHSIDVDDEYLEWIPFADRAAGTVELYNNGLIEKDEGRRKVNFGPSKSARAKQYRIPSNIVYEDDLAMVAANQPAPANNAPNGLADEIPCETTKKMEETIQELSDAHLDRVKSRLVKVAGGKAKQGGKAFLTWLDALQPESAPPSIQGAVDSIYKDFCVAANKIAESATTDEELRSAIDAI